MTPLRRQVEESVRGVRRDAGQDAHRRGGVEERGDLRRAGGRIRLQVASSGAGGEAGGRGGAAEGHRRGVGGVPGGEDELAGGAQVDAGAAVDVGGIRVGGGGRAGGEGGGDAAR